MQMWADLIPVPCAKRTTAMIEDYAGRLKVILLAKNMMPDERLARITKEQTRVEAWAKVLHVSMSTINGVYFAVNMVILVVMLGVAAIAKTKSGSSAFVGFSVLVTLFLGRYMYAQTLQSRMFKKVKIQLLNDAELIPVIHQTFQGRFELWWESHEISASTMCNIKMTTRRVFKALVGLGSVVFVVAGLLIRQALGLDGGGGLMR